MKALTCTPQSVETAQVLNRNLLSIRSLVKRGIIADEEYVKFTTCVVEDYVKKIQDNLSVFKEENSTK